MIRVLFSVLAVVVAVLAAVLKQPLLYAAAAVLVVIVVTLWITVLQRRRRESVQPYTPTTTAPALPEEDLQSLGIMDIRPKEPSAQPAGSSNGAPIETLHPVEAASSLNEFVTSSFEARPVSAQPTEEAAEETATPHGEDALVYYLRALRIALGAHTVGLLRQEDITPDYRVDVLVGAGETMQRDSAFSAETPLLTAREARQPVTVQRIGAGGLPPGSLGYSAAPATIREMALAPVPRPSNAEAYFLLADTLRDDHLSQEPAPTLLQGFARLLGTLLDTLAPPAEAPPRPRREIIAEEMEQARARNQGLALALVYLNRAEALDEDDVEKAELLLAARLREATEHQRVERFGELTYGVFYDGHPPDWGEQVQQALAHETGLLKGGISIGIARLQDRHQHPDDFRADATKALSEAYETGMCTIVE